MFTPYVPLLLSFFRSRPHELLSITHQCILQKRAKPNSRDNGIIRSENVLCCVSHIMVIYNFMLVLPGH